MAEDLFLLPGFLSEAAEISFESLSWGRKPAARLFPAGLFFRGAVQVAVRAVEHSVAGGRPLGSDRQVRAIGIDAPRLQFAFGTRS